MLSNGIHIGARRGVALGGGSGETPWWLAGGISAGDVVAAYQAKGAASLAASYVNLANPGTYDLTTSAAPTWDAATGWTFDGTALLDTGLVPVHDAWTIVARFANGSGSYHELCGVVANSPNRFFTLVPRNDSTRTYASGDKTTSVLGALGSGVMGLAGYKGYYNGTHEATVASGTATITATIKIGGARTVTVHQWIGDALAVVVCNTLLTDAQMAALSAAMAAL